jgi:hypothetical protein
MRTKTSRHSSTQVPSLHEAIRSQRLSAYPSCLNKPRCIVLSFLPHGAASADDVSRTVPISNFGGNACRLGGPMPRSATGAGVTPSGVSLGCEWRCLYSAEEPMYILERVLTFFLLTCYSTFWSSTIFSAWEENLRALNFFGFVRLVMDLVCVWETTWNENP